MAYTYAAFAAFCKRYNHQWDGTKKGRDFLMSQFNDTERYHAKAGI